LLDTLLYICFVMTDFRSAIAQTKTVEVSVEGLQSGNDPNLPPLMNPTMLEASDDLTNLSHLNEPAGEHFDAVLSLRLALSNHVPLV
jgi:myosin heavy subunit